jgi:hypothetical protein
MFLMQRCFVSLGLQVAIQPAVGRALRSGCAGLHVVLRVEVRSRAVRRSARVDDRERAVVPEALQRLQSRVQTEEAVEIDRAVLGIARFRNRDAGARAIVVRFAERHDDVEAVDRAALENRDQPLGADRPVRRKRSAREECRREAEAHERERSMFQENATRLHGYFL